MNDKYYFQFAENLKSLNITSLTPILLAFSGGPDSVYLLLLANRYFEKDKLNVAYVNYHDSEFVPKEEKVVSAIINKTNAKFYKKDVYLNYKISGFEEKARNIRYEWFSSLCSEHNLYGVVTAHQKNDDAETYLFQKKRSGLSEYLGLSPISTLYGCKVFRPLLFLTKSEIIEELRKENIEYFDDPTNRNPDRFRDNLRMNVLNTDERVNDVLKERDAFLPQCISENKTAVSYVEKDEYPLAEYRKYSYSVKRRICFACAKKLYPDAGSEKLRSATNLIFDYLQSYATNKIDLYDEIQLFKSKKRFFFAKGFSFPKDYFYRIEKPGIYTNEIFNLNLESPEDIHIKSFPVFIRPVKKEDEINTDILGKDAYRFLKTHEVPDWIRDFYPGIFNTENKAVYIPMWRDGKDKYLSLNLPGIILPKNGNLY